ncbi:MAG: LEM-3-like GIY-YIG domain-containing protein [Algoriphagus aquaeductus]|uniref:LEM-3-like GIY-YIG domain-containing protein n=1 Tax=Algoriphagus aquaeductus TaxID=475299 RepID=UPI003879B5A1
MNNSESENYVYVYIDPRNFEEFYYGQGKGSRKEAHLSDDGDSEKVKRINAIKKEGLNPIIKVIARGLTDQEALLVEKTLIWKLGKNLTNQSPGHFADKFRPHDTFHQDLAGFDFKNGLYYVNVGEGDHRCWQDCRQFGFLSAGQDRKWSDPIRTLEIGDIVVAYLKGKGYVGIGRVSEKAVRVNDFKFEGKSLKEQNLKVLNIFENSENERSEFLVKIDWIKTVESNQAKWKSNSGLFTIQLIKASLQNQYATREFLENEFDVNFKELLLAEHDQTK